MQDKATEDLELARDLESLMNWGTPQNSGSFGDTKKNVTPLREQKQTVTEVISISDVDMMCPICCLTFQSSSDIAQFHQHVEAHFIADDHPDYNILL